MNNSEVKKNLNELLKKSDCDVKDFAKKVDIELSSLIDTYKEVGCVTGVIYLTVAKRVVAEQLKKAGGNK